MYPPLIANWFIILSYKALFVNVFYPLSIAISGIEFRHT